MLDALRDLVEDGITLILVTHEVGFAQAIADHIHFLDDGEIIENGPSAPFFAETRDPILQAYLNDWPPLPPFTCTAK